MAFGPIIGGGSTAGSGSAFAPVTVSGTTGEIAGSGAADLDIALPGITQFYIIGARVSRTAGTSALVAVRLYPTDARESGHAMLFGDSFSGVDMPGPVSGPLDTTGGNTSRAGIAMTSDGEFARCTVHNGDFDDAGSYLVELDILPIDGA